MFNWHQMTANVFNFAKCFYFHGILTKPYRKKAILNFSCFKKWKLIFLFKTNLPTDFTLYFELRKPWNILVIEKRLKLNLLANPHQKTIADWLTAAIYMRNGCIYSNGQLTNLGQFWLITIPTIVDLIRLILWEVDSNW